MRKGQQGGRGCEKVSRVLKKLERYLVSKALPVKEAAVGGRL